MRILLVKFNYTIRIYNIIIRTHMVELYGLLIIKRIPNREQHKHVILSGKILIPWYAVAANKAIKKIAAEFGKIIAAKITLGTTKIYEHVDKNNKKYKINITTKHNGLICVLVTDDDYPRRISLTIIQDILDKFESKYNIKELDEINKRREVKDYCISKFNKECHNILKDNKDPSQNDDIYRTQKELKEVKNVIEENVNKLLNRGENLEDIMERAIELNNNAHNFYVSARKLRCCKIL